MTICLEVKAIPKTITLPDEEVRRIAKFVRPVVEQKDGLYYVEQRNPVLQAYVPGVIGKRAHGLEPIGQAPFLTRHERADKIPDYFKPSLAEPFSQLPADLLEKASGISTTFLGMTEFAEQQVGLTVLYRKQ